MGVGASVLPGIIVYNAPLPLGGEGGPPPALSSAGAGRVRGFLPSGSLSTRECDSTLAFASWDDQCDVIGLSALIRGCGRSLLVAVFQPGVFGERKFVSCEFQ